MTSDPIDQTSIDQQLMRLKQTGAAEADPIRFHYLEALARRLEASPLQHHWQKQKLGQALEDFRSRHRQLSQDTAPPQPHSPPSPLAELVSALDQAPAVASEPTRTSPVIAILDPANQQGPESAGASHAGAPRPLKAMARVQAGQQHQALQRRILAAIAGAPENAGPMNAHRLVIRAIRDMQALSPDYLHRFVTHIDTLMALEKLGRNS